MARKRRFSDDSFGPTVDRLRVITDRLERMPDLIDKLYRRYAR
jgi:hypothetical protein